MDRKAGAGTDVAISVGSVGVNLTCYGFHVWAEDFLAAAKSYSPNARKGAFVGHFLCCQSLELAMKAFLSLRGFDRRKLARKPFGHNLDRLLKDAIMRRCDEYVEMAPKDIELVRIANSWYDTPAGKRLQYFRVVDAMMGFRDAPEYASLEDIATRWQSSGLRQALLNG